MFRDEQSQREVVKASRSTPLPSARVGMNEPLCFLQRRLGSLVQPAAVGPPTASLLKANGGELDEAIDTTLMLSDTTNTLRLSQSASFRGAGRWASIAVSPVSSRVCLQSDESI